MKYIVACLMLSACSVHVDPPNGKPPNLNNRAGLNAAVQTNIDMSPAEIVSRAYLAAGGELFQKPQSLFLSGYNLIRKGGEETVWDKYAMWRVYAPEKEDARVANGKVRIEGWTQDEVQLLLSFDGKDTYNKDGKMESQSANQMWSNSFGFGAIRHALDAGWKRNRMADRLIDGNSTFMIELTDPSAKKTLFGIRQNDFAIVYVGFQTPRGWHERRYSNFFSNEKGNWTQAGRVRLFYDGVKSNEAIWTNFEVNKEYPDELFQINSAPLAPDF